MQPASRPLLPPGHSLADEAEGNDWQHRQQVDKHLPCRAPQHLSCGQPVEVFRPGYKQGGQAGKRQAGQARERVRRGACTLRAEHKCNRLARHIGSTGGFHNTLPVSSPPTSPFAKAMPVTATTAAAKPPAMATPAVLIGPRRPRSLSPSRGASTSRHATPSTNGRLTNQTAAGG